MRLDVVVLGLVESGGVLRGRVDMAVRLDILLLVRLPEIAIFLLHDDSSFSELFELTH